VLIYIVLSSAYLHLVLQDRRTSKRLKHKQHLHLHKQLYFMLRSFSLGHGR